MKHILISIFLVLLIPIWTIGQDLTVLSNGGFTNGYINQIDTLDGLVKRDENFQLIPIQVIVDTVDNPIIGGRTPSYKIKSSEKPFLLFKNHSLIKENIKGENFNYLYLEPDTSIDIELSGKHFNISAYGETENYENYTLIKNYKICLSWDDKDIQKKYDILTVKSVQITPSISMIEAPKIIWIGDLDGDNLLDIILSESVHYADYKIGLYLSKNIKSDKYPRTILIQGAID